MNETFQGSTQADLYKDVESFRKATQHYLIVFSTLPLENRNLTTPVVRLQSIFKNDELISKVTLSQIIAGIEEKKVKLRVKKFTEKVDYLSAVGQLIDEEIAAKELLPSFKLAWKKREEKMSNVFSHGIAIPHMVDESEHKRILMTIGILTQPVKYKGKKVSLIFLIGIPKGLDAELSKVLTKVYDFIFMISGNDDMYGNLLAYEPALPLTQITEGI
ncbi:PTS sugar transporter subunit IIA [Ligilactobacillus agilis]|uniref:PTS sugar transporter subunit IIA n=1 Tax=Ligilactobacillus agilis TaxID=1601 RepID=UPI001CDA89FE|nr:PTS sugar transporter subunit IIA [Ligilactobacillus agilis]